jgi:single-strand DNA-binding protein
MSNDTVVTITGNIVYEPELKRVAGDLALINITIASTPQKYDKASGSWVDGETMFIRATAWRTLAENIALQVRKGNAVIAQGKLVSKSYEKDGEKKTNFELELSEIGLALSRPTKNVEIKSEVGEDLPF